MPTINIQADVSVGVLVQAAEQLSAAELRQFTAQMLALNAKRTASNVTQEETELLLHINRRLPEDVQRHYDALIAKREAETLRDAEYTELLRLTKQVEAFDVARRGRSLACLRGVTLAELMRQLTFASPANGDLDRSTLRLTVELRAKGRCEYCPPNILPKGCA
jgi:hypothetical protein